MDDLLSILTGGIGGALLRLIPEGIKLFTAAADRKQELAVMDLVVMDRTTVKEALIMPSMWPMYWCSSRVVMGAKKQRDFLECLDCQTIRPWRVDPFLSLRIALALSSVSSIVNFYWRT